MWKQSQSSCQYLSDNRDIQTVQKLYPHMSRKQFYGKRCIHYSCCLQGFLFNHNLEISIKMVSHVWWHFTGCHGAHEATVWSVLLPWWQNFPFVSCRIRLHCRLLISVCQCESLPAGAVHMQQYTIYPVSLYCFHVLIPLPCSSALPFQSLSCPPEKQRHALVALTSPTDPKELLSITVSQSSQLSLHALK